MTFSRFLPPLLVVAPFLLTGGPAFAHAGSTAESPLGGPMRQMMGARTVEILEQMENQMMGAANHERMEGLMSKMMGGTLSADDRGAMVEMMRDPKLAPAAMTMMMRMMMPTMMQPGFSQAGWLGPPLHWTTWVTLILFWVVLALGILALWKWLFSGRKP